MKIEYKGNTPKIVDLPIPFMFKSERTGQVICDPIGDFSEADGQALLNISGPDGLFVLANGEKSKPVSSVSDYPVSSRPRMKGEPESMPDCKCECGEKIKWNNSFKYKPIARYIRGHFNRKSVKIRTLPE